MNDSLSKSDIISISDFSKQQIEKILTHTKAIKDGEVKPNLNGKIIANCFFEPSTRTRLSFEAAAQLSGASNIGFTDASTTSIKKGESLSDSIRVIADYADAIILRHPQEGSARFAAQISDKPVINAGDGSNQHPTQTLLDLYSMQECQGKLEKLNVALVGDLKYGRTVHSLAQACSLFDMRLFFVTTDSITMPTYICDQLKKAGIRFSFHESLDRILPKLDVIYMTRMQTERFDAHEFKTLQHMFHIDKNMLKQAEPHLRILHPLPRNKEIAKDVDNTDFAYYFEQAHNGLYVRQAILDLLLGEHHE